MMVTNRHVVVVEVADDGKLPGGLLERRTRVNKREASALGIRRGPAAASRDYWCKA